jgi:hypothetical protein
MTASDAPCNRGDLMQPSTQTLSPAESGIWHDNGGLAKVTVAGSTLVVRFIR